MKKQYQSPLMNAVAVSADRHLLAGSPMGFGGDANSSTVVEAPRRDFDFDDFDE